MGTVRGGKIICDACGCDCTRLHGMRMDVRRVVANDAEVKKLTDAVDEVFGKHDFIVCWMCTAKSLGIPTLAELKEAKDAEKLESTQGTQSPVEEGQVEVIGGEDSPDNDGSVSQDWPETEEETIGA